MQDLAGTGAAADGGGGWARCRSAPTLLWASLFPLMLLLHPYRGIVQDGRIYMGRGVADHDLAGVGRDLVFADDAQTGFTLLRPVIGRMLAALSPRDVSMLLSLAGSLLWLGAAIALARRLTTEGATPARGLDAWAAVVAVLALPAQYGAFATFGYAETAATPRIFAEAAVLAGLAALLGRRRVAGLALLLLALAIHPLMALPGLAIAAVLMVRDDRRWLAPIACVAAALLVAAALRLPLAGRLFEGMDESWWAILRQRCLYLFPTLWPSAVLGHVAPQAAAAILAGSLAGPRVRALLWGAVGVALCGVAVTLAFGDLVHGLLVMQLQPWRALWALAVLGNAGFALAALGLWRRGSGGRLVLSLLVLSGCSSDAPVLAVGLGAASVLFGIALGRGALTGLSPRVGWSAVAAAALVAGVAVAADAAALAVLIGSAQGGAVEWPVVVTSGVASIPLLAAAVALALRRPSRSRRPVLATAALLLPCAAALLLWDGRGEDRRALETGQGVEELKAILGPDPGPVLWIDEDVETWFLLGRPAFFNALQGAPVLFSRAMALDWSERGALLLRLGLARPSDLSPWASTSGRASDLVIPPGSVARFCADPRHPAGLVAPGAQLSAVPRDLRAALWHPSRPIRRLWIDDERLGWRVIDTFTVVSCGAPPAPPAGGGPLKSVRTD